MRQETRIEAMRLNCDGCNKELYNGHLLPQLDKKPTSNEAVIILHANLSQGTLPEQAMKEIPYKSITLECCSLACLLAELQKKINAKESK